MTDRLDRLTEALQDRYTLERELGAGGMATVYLAHDLRHDRRVALKVLRPDLAAVIGAQRFLAEIKTTANLQHPHILALFDSGEADGFVFYVMPYVEGESLRARIRREQQLPVDDAVRITREVADALDYAHQQGIVHRDIKPENILLHGGHALVADFGIALAVSRSDGGTRMTETGMSLGTPHYMSPEQAMGQREITARSDVYALGCVTYEMLTGEPPFTGPTAQAIVARVMTEHPRPLVSQRHTVPPHVEAAVLAALEKLPADRFASAAAFAAALANPAFRAAGPVSAGTAHLAGHGVTRWRRYAWPAAALMLAAAAVWGWLRPEPRPTVARYGLAFPADQRFEDSNNPGFALSPDGSWIVYQGPSPTDSQLWIKERDRQEAVPVPGTSTQSLGLAPMVSPDGEWIIFWASGQLRKVPKGGGSAITVADSVASRYRGAAWLDDGTIVYRDAASHLRRVPDVGGTAEVVWSPKERHRLAILPTALPGARGILFLACDASCSDVHELSVLDLRSGEEKVLVRDAGQGWYTPTGHIVYVRADGGVFAAPFDSGDLALTGPAAPVIEQVQVTSLVPDFALSRTGTLLMVYGAAGARGGIPARAVWVDRNGNETPVDPGWRFEVGANYAWSLSPDGAHLAIVVRTEGGDDIWIKELDRGPISRLTVDPAADFRPRWTPDGRSVSFISSRGANQDLYVRRADGTLPAELVLDLDDAVFEAEWARDGSWLVLRTGPARNRDIAALRPREGQCAGAAGRLGV